MRSAAAIIAAARACVGARFRRHGRNPAWGLDCVGLAAHALGVPAPADYPATGGGLDWIMAHLAGAGLRVRSGAARPGDLLLAVPRPHQFHLVVRTDAGFVHADAGLRRVVEVPGAPPWPIVDAWTGEG